MWGIETNHLALDKLLASGLPLLLDSAIKAALLLTMVAGVAYAFRRTSSAVRHLIWLLALAALPALPIAMLSTVGWNVLPDWTTPLSWNRPSDELLTDHATVVEPSGERTMQPTAAVATAFSTGNKQDPDRPRVQPTGWSVSTLVFLVWGLGCAFVLAPWTLGYTSLWQLQRRSERIRRGSIAALTARLREQLGIRRPVDLLLSEERSMPMQWGIIRPKILLPTEARSWSNDRLTAVLLHELAHVQRFDCLSQFVARLVLSLYWFHPLVWWARRRLEIETELACDDLTVANSPRDAVDYAEHLLFVAANTRVPRHLCAGAICMARPSRLEERVRAILDGDRNRHGLSLTRRLGCLSMIAAVSLPLALLRAEPPTGTESNASIPSSNEPTARDNDNSYIGRPTSGYESVKDNYDWMVRAVVAGPQHTKKPFEIAD